MWEQLASLCLNCGVDDEGENLIKLSILITKEPLVLQLRSSLGSSALHYAVLGNNRPAAKLLLDRGLSVNETNSLLQSPLHWAMQVRGSSMAKLLVSSGASIDQKDSEGNTPLHWAVEQQNRKAIRFLLAHNADRNAPNFQTQTPVLLSKIHRNSHITNILEGREANPRNRLRRSQSNPEKGNPRFREIGADNHTCKLRGSVTKMQ